MPKRITLAVAVALTLTTAARAGYLVPPFDDLPGPYSQIPPSYGGATWTNGFVVDQSWYDTNFSNSVTFPSPPNAAFNGSGGAVTVSLPSLTDGFAAEWATWADTNTFASFSSPTVTVAGYRNGVLVGETTFAVDPQFAWTNIQFGDTVNEVVLTPAASGEWFLFDAPEPASAALLGAALAGLAGVLRRRG